jgi:hypothetical protein
MACDSVEMMLEVVNIEEVQMKQEGPNNSPIHTTPKVVLLVAGIRQRPSEGRSFGGFHNGLLRVTVIFLGIS